MSLIAKLAARAQTKPIRVGLIGAGKFGVGGGVWAL